MNSESVRTRSRAPLALSIFCLLAAPAAYVRAQNNPRDLAPFPKTAQASDSYHSSFASDELALDARATTRDAPYSALAEKETIQILPDGSRVRRLTSARLHRDSQGRTRHDWFSESMPRDAAARPRIISGVDGSIYFIAPDRNVATKLSGVARIGARAQPAPSDSAAIVGERTEQLGTRTIEGVEASGTRTTTMIPATAAAPAVNITYERWYAPELRRNVLIRCTDTRFGEATFRLTQISRAEPAANLFALPPANQIREIAPDKPRAVKTSHSTS